MDVFKINDDDDDEDDVVRSSFFQIKLGWDIASN